MGRNGGRQRRKDNPDAAMRLCLGHCGEQFWSEGPWNRICPKCARRSEAPPPPPVHRQWHESACRPRRGVGADFLH